MGKHEDASDFIIQLSNGFYLSGGCENNLILYDNLFIEKMRINDLNDWVFKSFEKVSNKKFDKNLTLFCCINKELRLFFLDKENLTMNMQNYEIKNKTWKNCIEMNENNFIIFGLGGASYFINLLKGNNQGIEYIITTKTYKGGIKINDKAVALTSNSILSEGEDKLIIYNIESKKISNTIEGYSFTISINNLTLIPMENLKKENKILLCACKKYSKNQKNGILLVNLDLSDNKRIENEFFETDNFEVYCFCPILLIGNKNKNHGIINEEYKKKINIKDTDFFFVGGFDIDKREGQIKLFKIHYGKNIWKTTIEFIQHIEFDDVKNFEDFDGSISCVIQSKITGHILATCYNGNVYSFTPPNIEYYYN